MILAFLSVCGSTIHLIIRTRTLTLVSFSQFCRVRHYINPLARGKLPRKLLIYFFEISDGKKPHEETQQYCIRDFPRGQVWTFSCRVPPGGGSKPALSGDWFSFVRSIEIALDRERDQAGGSQFTIKVKKTTSTTRN